MGRRLLLLGICLLSLWGQLSLASTHRSHIGELHANIYTLTLMGSISGNRLSAEILPTRLLCLALNELDLQFLKSIFPGNS